MDRRIHRVAAAGNAVALSSLVLVLSQADLLFEMDGSKAPRQTENSAGRSEPIPLPVSPRRPGSPRRVVLVVVDGLRVDTANNPHAMPHLHRISSGGIRAVSQVQGTVPSSLAGIIALASGRVSPAGESLFDFQAPPSRDGGIFEALASREGRSFVAGPTLWTDLYGRWIDAAETDSTFGRHDRRLLLATLQALETDTYTLTVVHFGCTDAAAHQYGTESPQYLAAAHWCDQAIGQIHQALKPSTSLVVTSDHGNTRQGGHAGPEPDVLATPLIIAAPEHPPDRSLDALASPVPQTEIPRLLMHLLGHPAEPTAPTAEPALSPAAAGVPMLSVSIVLVGLAPLCGLAICTAVARRSEGRRPAFALNACFWIAAAIALGGWPSAALLLATVVLCFTALGVNRPGVARHPSPWSEKPGVNTSLPTAVAATIGTAGGGSWLLLGIAIGVVRFAEAHLALATGPSGGTLAAGVAVLGCLLYSGRACTRVRIPSTAHRSRPGSRLGILNGLPRCGLCGLVALAAYAAGGPSLLAVAGLAIAMGFTVGSIVDCEPTEKSLAPSTSAPVPRGPSLQEPWRPLAAGIFVCLLQILLSRLQGETVSLSTIDVRAAFETVEFPYGIGLAAGVVIASQALPTVALLVSCSPHLLRLTGPQLSYFCTGACAVAVGQVALGILMLSLPAPTEPWDALAVGMIVRALAESVYLFLGIAALLFLPHAPRTSPAPTGRDRQAPHAPQTLQMAPR